jgi:hypothetical protein
LVDQQQPQRAKVQGKIIMSSSSTAAFPLDHLTPSPTEQLCYVHCNCCDTILAVSDHHRCGAERAPPVPTDREVPSSCFVVCFAYFVVSFFLFLLFNLFRFS